MLFAIGAPVRAQSLSAEDLARRTIERRAVEAVIWGMPAVNAELMFQAMRDARADFNQVVYWSQPASWKNQTLTPNPSTIYFMPFFNTKRSGPMVLEIPQTYGGISISGSIDEAWQTAIEDVGAAGMDKGYGGKYLILPPGFRGPRPEGYIALRSSTYAGFALLRCNLKTADSAGVARAVAYGKRIRLYPLSLTPTPPPTTFVDASDVVFDSTIPYDLGFFRALDRFVQREPWLTRDKVMIEHLRTIGIEKGKPFDPDAGTQRILADAANEARAWLDQRYEAQLAAPFAAGARWALPVDQKVSEGLMTNFAEPNTYPVDGRGLGYSMGYFSAKRLGGGQFYLMTIMDKAGNALSGGKSYRLQTNAPPVGGGFGNNFADFSPLIMIPGSGQFVTNFVDGGVATNAARYYRVRLGP